MGDTNCVDRRQFIGGSDARIIMGQDEKALVRLWREKRGEVGPEDLSGDLIVQLGLATEELNRAWYERNTGCTITDIQSRVRHPVIAFMAATLDGVVTGTGAVYEAKFMLPWSFSEEFAAEKYMAQLQHNMWVTNARMAALSIITGGGKWVEISIAADPLYQHLLLTAEKKFWRCVSFGEPPRLFGVEPPRPRIEAARIVDTDSRPLYAGRRPPRHQASGGLIPGWGASNSWGEFAAVFLSTRSAFLDHEKAKTELKGLMPEDAKEAWLPPDNPRRSPATH
jgi:predicted phage-related endonuclease